jgi:hypothetical protein
LHGRLGGLLRDDSVTSSQTTRDRPETTSADVSRNDAKPADGRDRRVEVGTVLDDRHELLVADRML